MSAASKLVVATTVALFSASTSAAMAEVVRVDVNKVVFSPALVSAHVGDTIEWVNADFMAHTAAAKDQQWEVMLEPGKAGRIQLKKVGTIDYFCRFHPNMTGSILVTE